MNTLEDKIVEFLQGKPDQKAADIARALNAEKTEINQLLYSSLKGRVIQDRAYRWSLVKALPNSTSSNENIDEEQFANTDLARLCRYYLACLGYDETGVSTFLTSKYGDPNYIEVHALPRSSDDISESEAARKMLGRKRSEQGRYELYFGYPTYIRLMKSSKSDWEGYMLEPILLFPIEKDSGSGHLSIDLSYPIINQKPFQTFTNSERDMVMNELVQLEQELGLTGEDRIDIDEIAMRLQAVRPEWPWKENIDASTLSSNSSPISGVNAPGIYNRAVIVMAEKSPFTQGLEKELRDLAQLPESSYAHTALGRWLNGNTKTEIPTSDLPPLLEVLPMNMEQRQAVAAALTQPVTIITGPPGTGKSQVVTNLLINAAWAGKRVLFASKNNKAVDVVETRVNSMGSRPILLRVGAKSYQVRLAEFILSLMSLTTSAGDKDEFKEAKTIHESLLAKYEDLNTEEQKIINLRNTLDQLEQKVENVRQALGASLFAKSSDIDIFSIRNRTLELQRLLRRADRERVSLIEQIFWFFLKDKRFNELCTGIKGSQELLGRIGVEIAAPGQNDLNTSELRKTLNQAIDTLDKIAEASTYFEKLKDLQSLSSLEDVARKQVEFLDKISRHSQFLWKLWLRIQPSLISAGERQNLAKYSSLLKMVIEAGDDGQLSTQIAIKYKNMLGEISHLLPCWAVTSLSARGRIPFQANNFDIVIFDEASQCDIASALPLLYRAKSVVIIGDPQQLSHISGLQKGQDQTLLERYDLIDDYPHWSYSHQSLFALGASQVSLGDIISLVDHHRSHADIISFSNIEFYEQRLRVATKYDTLRPPNRSESGIRWIDVKGHVNRPGSGGAVNSTEAKAVVEAIYEMVIKNGYRGSVGVVTPFRAQANLITELKNQRTDLSELLIQCGFLADTVHKFQGDERDVMFFSPVVSEGISNGALGFLRSNGNLFNVAITRARSQLVVVGDMAACGTSDVGYLSRFASYVADLSDKERSSLDIKIQDLGPQYPEVSNPDIVSDWERIFYIDAYKAGFRLIPQYQVEKYIVDFLLIDGKRRLAIEIDGERYHRNWTGELCRRDQIRNQRLIELGYDVMRFWVYEVRDDMAGCLKKITEWQNNKG